MKCRACGYVSFEDGPCCKRCGADREGRGGKVAADLAEELASLRLPPEPAHEKTDAGPRAESAAEPEALFADDEDELVAAVEFADEGELPGATRAFHLDDDIIPPALASRGDEPAWDDTRAEDAPARSWGLDDPVSEEAEPIIDRHEEIPERFWAPEGAPVGRRVAAQAIDQAVLLALLALFYVGALAALRLAGYDAGHLLTAEGLAGVLVPFGVLDLLAGAAYFTFFHGWRGRTPGKGLAGIEVRTAAGEQPTYARALLRSLAGILALGVAGVGLAWALFEPRRRGWADLASGTVVRSSHFV